MSDKKSESEIDHKRIADDLRMLYSTTVSEVTRLKQQQWQVTNYVALIFAAIASMGRLVQVPLSVYERAFFSITTVVVWTVGTMLVRMFHRSIQKRYQRLNYLRQNEMPDQFVSAWHLGHPAQEKANFEDERWGISAMFYAIFSFGASITVWLLWR